MLRGENPTAIPSDVRLGIKSKRTYLFVEVQPRHRGNHCYDHVGPILCRKGADSPRALRHIRRPFLKSVVGSLMLPNLVPGRLSMCRQEFPAPFRMPFSKLRRWRNYVGCYSRGLDAPINSGPTLFFEWVLSRLSVGHPPSSLQILPCGSWWEGEERGNQYPTLGDTTKASADI